MSFLLAAIDLPRLGREGADDLEGLLTAFYALFGGGFVVAVAGHVAGSRLLQATGIALVMLGTVFFVGAVASKG